MSASLHKQDVQAPASLRKEDALTEETHQLNPSQTLVSIPITQKLRT